MSVLSPSSGTTAMALWHRRCCVRASKWTGVRQMHPLTAASRIHHTMRGVMLHHLSSSPSPSSSSFSPSSFSTITTRRPRCTVSSPPSSSSRWYATDVEGIDELDVIDRMFHDRQQQHDVIWDRLGHSNHYNKTETAESKLSAQDKAHLQNLKARASLHQTTNPNLITPADVRWVLDRGLVSFLTTILFVNRARPDPPILDQLDQDTMASALALIRKVFVGISLPIRLLMHLIWRSHGLNRALIFRRGIDDRVAMEYGLLTHTTLFFESLATLPLKQPQAVVAREPAVQMEMGNMFLQDLWYVPTHSLAYTTPAFPTFELWFDVLRGCLQRERFGQAWQLAKLVLPSDAHQDLTKLFLKHDVIKNETCDAVSGVRLPASRVPGWKWNADVTRAFLFYFNMSASVEMCLEFLAWSEDSAGMSLGTHAYNLLLGRAAWSRDQHMLDMTLAAMEKRNIPYDAFTYSKLLLFWKNQRNVFQINAIWREMRMNKSITPNRECYNIGLHGTVWDRGSVDDLISEVVAQMKRDGVDPDTDFFTHLLLYYRRRMRRTGESVVSRAFEVTDALMKIGCEPDIMYYNVLLSICSSAQDQTGMNKVVAMMKEHKVEWDVFTILALTPQRQDIHKNVNLTKKTTTQLWNLMVESKNERYLVVGSMFYIFLVSARTSNDINLFELLVSRFYKQMELRWAETDDNSMQLDMRPHLKDVMMSDSDAAGSIQKSHALVGKPYPSKRGKIELREYFDVIGRDASGKVIQIVVEYFIQHGKYEEAMTAYQRMVLQYKYSQIGPEFFPAIFSAFNTMKRTDSQETIRRNGEAGLDWMKVMLSMMTQDSNNNSKSKRVRRVNNSKTRAEITSLHMGARSMPLDYNRVVNYVHKELLHVQRHIMRYMRELDALHLPQPARQQPHKPMRAEQKRLARRTWAKEVQLAPEVQAQLVEYTSMILMVCSLLHCKWTALVQPWTQKITQQRIRVALFASQGALLRITRSTGVNWLYHHKVMDAHCMLNFLELFLLHEVEIHPTYVRTFSGIVSSFVAAVQRVHKLPRSEQADYVRKDFQERYLTQDKARDAFYTPHDVLALIRDKVQLKQFFQRVDYVFLGLMRRHNKEQKVPAEMGQQGGMGYMNTLHLPEDVQKWWIHGRTNADSSGFPMLRLRTVLYFINREHAEHAYEAMIVALEDNVHISPFLMTRLAHLLRSELQVQQQQLSPEDFVGKSKEYLQRLDLLEKKFFESFNVKKQKKFKSKRFQFDEDLKNLSLLGQTLAMQFGNNV